MKKQILFAHSGGAQGGSGKGSFDFVEWLRKELGEAFEIHCPLIENPEEPTYEMWQSMFNGAFAELETNDSGCILIGHSLGASVLLKYLSEQRPDIKIDGLFLVATPYWGEENWDVDEFKLENMFVQNLPEIPAIHLFQSKNDPFVPYGHMQVYKSKLPQAVPHTIDGDSHAFADGLPKLVEVIRKLASKK